MHRFRVVSSLVVFALVALTLPPYLAVRAQNTVVAARSGPAHNGAAPSRPVAPQDGPDCLSSPFGKQLVLGRVNQPFLSYTDNTGLLHYDRLALDSGNNLIGQKLWISPDAALSTNNHVGAVATDVDGDERADFVEAFQNKSNQFTLVKHLAANDAANPSYQASTISGPQYRDNFAAAAGNLYRNKDAQTRNVVVATIRRGPGGTGQDPNYVDVRLPLGGQFWRNRALLNAVDVQIATGDLDLDGYDDDMAVAVLPQERDRIELFVLKYTPGYTGETGIVAQDLKAVAHTTLAGSNMLGLRIALGNIDSSYQDEIALAYTQDQPDNQGVASSVQVHTFGFVVATKTLAERDSWIKNVYNNNTLVAKSLALGIGDVDRDGLGEITVGYINFGSGPGFLAIHTLDDVPNPDSTKLPTLVEGPGGYWASTPNPSDPINYNTPHSLSFGVDDLNGDGWHEIVVAFRPNDTHFRMLYLNRTPPPGTDPQAPPQPLQLRSILNRDGTANWLQVQLGDFNNASLKAQYGAAVSVPCVRVDEPHLANASFAPPYWQNIQQRAGEARYVYGSIGKSKDTNQTTTSTVINKTSDSFSASFGLELDAEFVSGSLKATFGYERAASISNGSTTENGQTTTNGWENQNGDFIVYQNTTYDCYSYKLTQQQRILDSELHACQVKDRGEFSGTVADWDTRNSPANNPNALQYVPIAQDWSSLTAFRGAQTAQSSTTGDANADRAVDANTAGALGNGSVAMTNAEAQPWWQVDLGTVQPLTKLRVWNRTDTTCGGPCGAQLTNFRVFVSDTDFQAISNDPDALKNDARVRTYEHSGPAGSVTSFITLFQNLPISGRFVRVQLVGSGTLALAEVQVFGPNHVEPQRYPRAVRDNVNNNQPTPDDGVFEVEVFNPTIGTNGSWQWVRQRGNLKWNGADQNFLSEIVVGPGDSLSYWSFQQRNGGSFIQGTTLETTTKVGVELEASAGVFVKVAAGAAYERSSGIATENTVEHAWSNQLEFGGGVTGFPSRLSGSNATVTWPNHCNYRYQPYFYEMTDESSIGFRHRFMVIDYIVPASLDRRADLRDCLRGEYNDGANQRPQAQNVQVATASNTAVSINVLARASDPNGNNLSVLQVGGPAHGTARIEGGSVVYTPYPNFVGSDTFSFTITDGALTADATITVNVTNDPVQLTPTATPPDGTATATPPPSGTTIATPSTGTLKQVYLPLIQR